MQIKKYDGQFFPSMERMVETRMEPRHFTLSPLDVLFLQAYELKCEQRELGIVSEKDGE